MQGILIQKAIKDAVYDYCENHPDNTALLYWLDHKVSVISRSGTKRMTRHAKCILWMKDDDAAEDFQMVLANALRDPALLIRKREGGRLVTHSFRPNIHVIHTCANDHLILTQAAAHSVLTMPAKILREHLEQKIGEEKSDEEISKLEECLQALASFDPLYLVQLRKESGTAYKLTYFDKDIGKRRQRSVGDIMLMIAENKPVLSDTGLHKFRSDIFSRDPIVELPGHWFVYDTDQEPD